jgi:hypothetical protein
MTFGKRIRSSATTLSELFHDPQCSLNLFLTFPGLKGGVWEECHMELLWLSAGVTDSLWCLVNHGNYLFKQLRIWGLMTRWLKTAYSLVKGFLSAGNDPLQGG